MTGPESDVKRFDPRGLIHEAYRIDGITAPDCRTIFLDWSLGDMGGAEAQAAVPVLLAHYGAEAPEHPMTQVLRAALEATPEPRRRGGYRSRKRE